VSAAVALRPISAAAAAAILARRRPPDVTVAPDYPTEFSQGVAAQVGRGSPLGPYFVHRAGDDVVVGEIGGAFVAAGTVEIGYATVPSCRGRGYATAAVHALMRRAETAVAVARVIAHTPLDRPASGRVLAKAGFACLGETEDEQDGVPLRVLRWQWIPQASFHIRPATPADAPAVTAVALAAGLDAWQSFLGADRITAANAARQHPADLIAVDGNTRARAFYERRGWIEEGPPRVRDWHGARLVEPRYVKRL
jgi:RimJ/RimL family protein N-acetyltransferase